MFHNKTIAAPKAIAKLTGPLFNCLIKQTFQQFATTYDVRREPDADKH